jgi:alkylhydroperoxidase family enzyme
MATVPDLEAHLTPELRAQAEEMKRTRGLSTLGFYGDLMAHPALFQHVQALGTFLRFHGTLPARDREAVILFAAVGQRSPFEWQTHQKTARAAGLTEVEIAAIGSGSPLDSQLSDLRETVLAVLAGKSVPQELFDRLTLELTLPGAIEVITLASFYRMMAGLGAAFDSTLPGAEPPPWDVTPSGETPA